jgi:hypothetical protein
VYPFGHVDTRQIELKDLQLLQNPPLIGRFFVFQYTATNVIQAVFYWYQSSTFDVNSTPEQKQVEISLITYPQTLEDLPTIENQTLAVAASVASFWKPVAPWSQAALFLSQHSLYIAATTCALLPILIVFYSVGRRKQRKADAKLYQKLSELNRQTIDAVEETEKTMMPTLRAIAAVYELGTGEPIKDEEMLQRLSNVERTGIIERIVAKVKDEPYRVWRSAKSDTLKIKFSRKKG